MCFLLSDTFLCSHRPITVGCEGKCQEAHLRNCKTFDELRKGRACLGYHDAMRRLKAGV